MGGLFDVKSPLHGVAFALGVPTLPVGALLISYHLIKGGGWNRHASGMLFSAHSIWISIVLMTISMILMINGFKQTGIPFGEGVTPPESVPAGVIALAGYFNRLVVLCCAFWVIFMAKVYLSISPGLNVIDNGNGISQNIVDKTPRHFLQQHQQDRERDHI